VTGPEQKTGRRTARCEHTGSDAKTDGERDGECDIDVYSIQIAVAIVDDELGRLNEGDGDGDGDGDDNHDDDYIDEIAGKFATGLHNSWGIGYEIPMNDENGIDPSRGGGTGVLVFLSVRDRVVFISVGGALRHILTNGRIDRIVQNDMTPELKRANYEQGLINAIDDIAELLEKGEEPSISETIWGFLFANKEFLAWTGFWIGFMWFQRWNRKRERQLYAKAATRLSELDQARAEALRGSYCQATSCPICLEDFRSEKVGSDGQPLQLLRCGHVFDKTCFDEWVLSGRGNVTKCPVCRADVGCSSNSSSSSGPSSVPGSEASNPGSEDPTPPASEDPTPPASDNHSNAMDLYRQDRNFRLGRLSELYPRYITVDHVARWSSPNFEGSLARDRSFRNNDPAFAREARGHGSSQSGNGNWSGSGTSGGGGYSFGGGTSGGGRGSRF